MGSKTCEGVLMPAGGLHTHLSLGVPKFQPSLASLVR